MTTQELKNQLERLIDGHSTSTVLEALSLVCYEKANHIEENWQDKNLASTWNSAGNMISKIQDKICC